MTFVEHFSYALSAFSDPRPCSPRETIQMEVPSHPQTKLGRCVMRTHGCYPVTAEGGIQAARRPQRECERCQEGGKMGVLFSRAILRQPR